MQWRKPSRARWYAHWHRSWSAHETSALAPSGPRWLEVARRAHARLAPVHRQLTRFAGDGDGWLPPVELVPATLASHIFPDHRQRQNVG